MEPLVNDWASLGLGFSLDDAGGGTRVFVSHAIRADNIILFATSYEMMQCMVNQLNVAFTIFKDCMGKQYFLGMHASWFHRDESKPGDSTHTGWRIS